MKNAKNFCFTVDACLKDNSELSQTIERYMERFHVYDFEEYVYLLRNFRMRYRYLSILMENVKSNPGSKEYAEVHQKAYNRACEFEKSGRMSIRFMLRSEFDFLEDNEKVTTIEGRLRRLIFLSLDCLVMKPAKSELLKKWTKWFCPIRNIPNEIYETYDFERSGNVILHIIDSIALPPLQAQYLKHYLDNSTFNYTDFEMEIIKKAGENVLLNESKICRMFDELMEN